MLSEVFSDKILSVCSRGVIRINGLVGPGLPLRGGVEGAGMGLYYTQLCIRRDDNMGPRAPLEGS